MLVAGEDLQVERDEGPLRPGDTFERYEIRSEIARGGSAFVYSAYQEFLDRHVAIKVIPCKKEQAREFRRRAKAEAVVLSRLRHPNVVPVYDAGVTDDGTLIYIVMEQLDGCTLREVLQTIGPLSVPEALVIGAQACDAVEAAHRHGAIHRDLKPENLFIEHGNHLRVLDFGVAKFRAAGFATTAKHRWHGTPLYMSPEHLQGRGVTARSDIYALGTLLWESLAGRNPCLNGIETPTFQEIGWIQIGSVPPLLTEVVRAIPDYVARVIQRAIAKAPEHRYGSMHEFGVALRDAERRFTLECRERRLAPVSREMVESTRANNVAPRAAAAPVFGTVDTEKSAAPAFQTVDTEPSAAPAWAAAAAPGGGAVRRDTVREPLAGAGGGPRDTVRMPLSAKEPPAAAPDEHAPAARAATAEQTPSPLAAPVEERQSVRSATPALARRAPRAKRAVSSARLGVLGAVVGLVVAIPIGVTVGLARRHAAASATRKASATAVASASAQPVLAAAAAPSATVKPAPPTLAPAAPTQPNTSQAPATSAAPAPSGVRKPPHRAAASARAAASKASSPWLFGDAPTRRHPAQKQQHAAHSDGLPSSGLGTATGNNDDQPLF